MKIIYTELRELYRKGFDLGLDSEAQQILTTLQMKEMLERQHKNNMAEIDDWLKNQEGGLKRRIQEIEYSVSSKEGD